MSSTLINNARLKASLLKKYPTVPQNLFNVKIQSTSTTLSPLQTCYFKSYHTSPLSFAKDPKKDDFAKPRFDNKPSQNKTQPPPPQAKPQQKAPPPPPQKTATPTGKPPVGSQKPISGHLQTIPSQGENMPRTVIRGPESLTDIKGNISKLCDEEIQLLKETEELGDSVEFHLGKEYLQRTNYALEETKDGIIRLTRSVDNQVVVVTFDRYEEPDAGGKDENENDEDEDVENEEDEENEDEEPEEEMDEGEPESAYEQGSHKPPMPYKHNLHIEVAFKNPEGSVKGRWTLTGYAGKDNRLYISDMAINKGEVATTEDAEGAEGAPLAMVPFETLSDDLQDRLYDFLDEIGVDDQLAHFVKQHLVEAEVKQASGFLQDLKDLMK